MTSSDDKGAACDPYTGPVNTTWIALVKRGTCPFETKFDNVAGSAATIVYDNKYNQSLVRMSHGEYEVITFL